MRLYELSDAYRAIQELLESGDCDQQELEGRLAIIEGSIQEKVDSLAAVHAHLERQAEAAKAEKQRLAKREERYARDAARLEAWLQRFLEETGQQKVTGQRFTVSLKRCPPSVRVLSEHDVPLEFIRVVPEKREVDKRAVLDFFGQGGEIPPGVDIIVDRQTLNIK